MTAAELAHACGDVPASLPFERELANWQGGIAHAAANGGGLDVYRAALNWAKQGVPPETGLREKAKQEICDAAGRHLIDAHGARVLEEIYFSTFPEDLEPSNDELDALALATDSLAIHFIWLLPNE